MKDGWRFLLQDLARIVVVVAAIVAVPLLVLVSRGRTTSHLVVRLAGPGPSSCAELSRELEAIPGVRSAGCGPGNGGELRLEVRGFLFDGDACLEVVSRRGGRLRGFRASPLPAALRDLPAAANLLAFLAFAVQAGLLVVALPWAGRTVRKRGWRGLLGPDPGTGTVVGVLAGGACLVTGTLGERFLAWSVGGEPDSPLEQLLGNGVVTAPLLLAILGGAPVAEELFFRGVVFERLAGSRPVVVIGTAAVLFGALHLDLLRLPILVVLGLILGIARHRSGGLLAPVLAHALHNGLSVVLARLGTP